MIKDWCTSESKKISPQRSGIYFLEKNSSPGKKGFAKKIGPTRINPNLMARKWILLKKTQILPTKSIYYATQTFTILRINVAFGSGFQSTGHVQ